MPRRRGGARGCAAHATASLYKLLSLSHGSLFSSSSACEGREWMSQKSFGHGLCDDTRLPHKLAQHEAM
jgi:hypothetical protein